LAEHLPYLCVLTSIVIFCCLLHVYPIVSYGESSTLLHYPDKIVFDIGKMEMTTERTAEIYLRSNSNIDNVIAFVTRLESDSNHESIPRTALSLNSTLFNVTANSPSILTLSVKLDKNYPVGVYTGRLTLLASNMSAVDTVTQIRITENKLEYNVLKTTPESVRFILNDKNSRLQFRPIDISSNRSVDNIKTAFSDLFTENGTILAKENFRANRSSFNVYANNLTTIEVEMDLGGIGNVSPGIYQGTIRFSGENTLTLIPLTVVIDPSPIWFNPLGILLILIGMALSIILILVREGARIRNAVWDSAKKASNGLITAIDEGRKSTREILRGLRNFQMGVAEIRRPHPNMVEATNYFSSAKEFFDRANNDGDQEDIIQPPELEDVDVVVHDSRAAIAYSFQGDKLTGIAFGILLVIVILTTLQSVSPDVLTIDSIGKGIVAVTIGIGSPAVANLLAPLIRGSTSQQG
jgi:hypothetical protein